MLFLDLKDLETIPMEKNFDTDASVVSWNIAHISRNNGFRQQADSKFLHS